MPDESDERTDGDGSGEPRADDGDPAEPSDSDSIFDDEREPIFDDDPPEADPNDSFADDLENGRSPFDDEPGSSDGSPSNDADAEGDGESGSEAAAEPPVETDGEGVVGDRNDAGGEPAYPDPDEDVGGISAPPDDEEMPLADHIEEMVLRFAKVLLVAAAGTAIGLLGASQAIEHVWFNVFPYQIDEVPPPHVYHPLELWLTRIKLSALLGIMVGLPMFVYQCYLFMRPGLYSNERKYYLAAVPTSVVLAGVGMLFSYLLVLPVLFRYFTYYAEGSAQIAFGLGDTFDLIITLTGFLAIVFQIPLFIMLAIMMGVTTRRWLAEKRLYFWAAFAGLSFMFTFDPTAMAPVLVAVTMILLFEGTLAILKWVGRE